MDAPNETDVSERLRRIECAVCDAVAAIVNSHSFEHEIRRGDVARLIRERGQMRKEMAGMSVGAVDA